MKTSDIKPVPRCCPKMLSGICCAEEPRDILNLRSQIIVIRTLKRLPVWETGPTVKPNHFKS